MGSELRRELRDLLGPDIKGLKRAIALEIADDARYDDNMKYDPTKGRRSRLSLAELVSWTGAKDERIVREELRRLALAGWEFRVPLGVGKDGRKVFAWQGRAMEFRVPEGPTVVATEDGPQDGQGPTTVAEGPTVVAEEPTDVATEATTVGPPSPGSSSRKSSLSDDAPEADPPEPPAAPVDEREGSPLVDKLKGIHDATGDEVRTVLDQVGREGWAKSLSAWALSEKGGIDFAERLARIRATPAAVAANLDPWQECTCGRVFQSPEPGPCQRCRGTVETPVATSGPQAPEGFAVFRATKDAMRRPTLPPVPPPRP
jgi:hypothetical protein